MAISTIHRLTTRLTRHPSLSLSSITHIRTATTSAKVSDRIVKISAIDPDGQKREILGMSGQTLLKALTNSGMIDPDSHRLEDIDACSAECEVSIAEEWLQKLPKASYDEEYVLKRNSRNRWSKERDIRHDGSDLTKSPNEFGYARPGSRRLEDIDACSAECEVNIAKLSPVTYDEECVLKRNSRNSGGQKREILGMLGQTLLKALTNLGMIDPDSHRLEDIDACSAECKVNIAQEWLQKLPPASMCLNGICTTDSHRLEDIDACSTECEVNIAQEWLQKLPPAPYDKEYVLKQNSRNRVLNKHSRLGCQVVLSQELQGMVVAVPEAKPWDIP